MLMRKFVLHQHRSPIRQSHYSQCAWTKHTQ